MRRAIFYLCALVILLGSLYFVQLALFHAWASNGPPMGEVERRAHSRWSVIFCYLSLGLFVLSPSLVFVERALRRRAAASAKE